MDIIQVGNDKRLSLGREEWVRPFPFGSNWSRLRIVAWVNIPDVGGLTNAQYMLGVCAGPYGWHSPQSTDVFCSGMPRPDGGGNWNSYAGPPVNYSANMTGGAIKPGSLMAWCKRRQVPARAVLPSSRMALP